MIWLTLTTLVIPALVVYWFIGVLVSVADAMLRTWMQNHPRWQLNPPMGIRPTKVALLWVLYLPIALIYAIKWLFTTGTIVAHKILLDRITKPTT